MSIQSALAGLRLRPWQDSDLDPLVQIANDRDVWRNLTELFPSPYMPQDARNWLAFANTAAPSLHLAIEIQGRCAGGIGLIAGEGVARCTGQFGYWLGRQYWGRGYATAAAAALVGHAREQRQFARLESQVFAWNPASMRVLEKVGFTREGVLRRSVWKDGELIDSMLYALLVDP